MNKWKRGLMIGLAVATVVSGVTFAALQTQPNKLNGSVIQTAGVGLQISLDGNIYSYNQPGMIFNNLVPGGSAQPQNGYNFYLKNTGNAPLAIKFAVSSAPSNPDGVDLSKVNVLLNYGNGPAQSFTLAALIDANTTGGLTVNSPAAINPGSTAPFTMQVSMASDAVTGSSASLGNIDFAFTGLAVPQ